MTIIIPNLLSDEEFLYENPFNFLPFELLELIFEYLQPEDLKSLLDITGWLHDVIEDTETTREELADRLSVRVAALVVEVSDDMGLPKAERRRLQVVGAPHKSPAAKLIKIADKISNIRGRIAADPSEEERADLADYVGWAEQVVSGCRGGNAWLDRTFDETVKAARGSV